MPAGAGVEAEAALEEVVVEGTRTAPEPTAKEDPTAFGTVLEAKDFAGERLEAADLLLQAPGTVVRRTPGQDSLLLRGASPDQSLVLLDGIPLNPAAGGGVDLRMLPAGLVERVTVLRGNEGARFGAGALGGVALLETRRPRAGSLEATAALTAGSFGTAGFDGSLWGGGRRASGLLGVSLLRTEGDFPAAYDPTPAYDPSDVREARLENNDLRRGALLARGELALGGVALTALAQGTLAERGIPGTFYAPSPTTRREDQRFLASVRAAGRPAAEVRLEGGADVRVGRLAVEAETPAYAGPPATDGGAAAQDDLGLFAVTGAEATPAEFLLLRADGRAGQELLDGPYHGRHERAVLAASLSPEVYLGDTVTVAPVVRVDRVGEHQGVSPKLGVAFRPVAPLELRANAGWTFRPPSLGELHLEQGPVRPNPELEPERGWSADGGVVLRFARAQLVATAFYARTEDLISYEVVSGGVTRPFNFLDGEIRGGELEGVWRPVRPLTLSASWARAEALNLRDDPRYYLKELPYRPRDRVSARAAARHRGLEGFSEASWQAAQFTNRANTAELPAQTSVRAGAGARVLDAPWELWASGQVDNLLDATLVDQLGFPQPGRAFYVVLRAVPPGGDGAGSAGDGLGE